MLLEDAASVAAMLRAVKAGSWYFARTCMRPRHGHADRHWPCRHLRDGTMGCADRSWPVPWSLP
ncbi:hypothetical protein XaFJ1_GM002068 [Xanthomonas albilineans]|nr:hypothetical protein XaFJ1_GM002068 [Xanthomonas albilineans]